MRSELLRAVVSMAILYVLQIFVIPMVLPMYFPMSDVATGILVCTIILASFIGMFCVTKKLSLWLISDLLYYALLLTFTGGAYDISILAILVDGVLIPLKRLTGFYLVLLIALITTASQIVAWLAEKLVKWMQAPTEKEEEMDEKARRDASWKR